MLTGSLIKVYGISNGILWNLLVRMSPMFTIPRKPANNMQDVKSLKALDGSYYDGNVNSETDTFTINETYAVFM